MDSNLPYLSFQKLQISRRLWWGAIVAILLSSALATLILLHLYHNFSQVQQNARLLQDLQLVLEAANRISEERAPSNVVMDGSGSPTVIQQLSVARAETDSAILKLADGQAVRLPLAKNLHHLNAARQKVDQAIRSPQVNYADIQSAVDTMLSTYDAFQELVSWQANELIRSDPTLLGTVMRALALCDLRDSAGRIGSYLMLPLASRAPLTPTNLERIIRTQERISMQWKQLELGGGLGINSVDLLGTEAQQHFDEEGSPLIEGLITEGRVSGSYALNATTFTNRYNATLIPLETWRRAYLQQLVTDYRMREQKSAKQIFFVLVFSLTTVGLISWIILIVRMRVLQPLLDVSESMIALVDEQPFSNSLRRRSAKELDVLFDALDVVAARLGERAKLVRELKRQAETDPLTRLLNRRSFEKLGKAMLVDRSGDRAFLIMLDLDHFKSINDLHGHPVGDSVLIAVADALRFNVRPTELVARIGGEEFALLFQAPNMTDAISTAERLLVTLRRLKLTTPGGTPIPISASIGIAESHNITWDQLISKADVALYEAKHTGRDRICISE